MKSVREGWLRERTQLELSCYNPCQTEDATGVMHWSSVR